MYKRLEAGSSRPCFSILERAGSVLLCISGIDTIENYKIYETYMHSCRISYTGKIGQVWQLPVNYEYLLVFSCKRRHFCPSCHQKRVVEFGEYLCEEILKAVPHRHFVFSIPKILRRYFLYDRSLLSDLSRCGWESLKAFFQETLSEQDAAPGAVIAITIRNFPPHPGPKPAYLVTNLILTHNRFFPILPP